MVGFGAELHTDPASAVCRVIITCTETQIAASDWSDSNACGLRTASAVCCCKYIIFTIFGLKYSQFGRLLSIMRAARTPRHSLA